MIEKSHNRIRLTAEDLDLVRANLEWRTMFAGLGLQKSEKKSKPNDWWALSPFNDEKTPSFHMCDGGRWYDFSAGIGGGCVELIQQLEGLNCFDAGQLILDRGWSKIPEKVRSKSPGNSKKSKRAAHKTKAAIHETLDPENEPIRQDLLPNCNYHEALESRGISEECAQELGIGYLGQGRSPLRGRIVFQVRDARPTKEDPLGLERVVLSHLGRAVSDDQDPKYLMYEGFQKSREILGQDRLWLDPEAIEQIKATGFILITEGPFDWAKANEAGVHNVGAVFGSTLSEAQARKLKALAEQQGINGVRLLFDRDKPGQTGAKTAAELLKELGLEIDCFDWERPLGQNQEKPVRIPEDIGDLADLEVRQIQWLRRHGWL